MKEIVNLSVSELKTKLSAKEVSAVEIANAFLGQIEKHADLNCFLQVEKDQVLKDAAAADEEISRGVDKPLLGIPVGLKDNICAKALRTTCASRILENFEPPYDATVVTRLKAAGAVVLGKLNLDEFAMGSSTENSAFGSVKNPWDRERVPGGSSGGSAAAVAARLAPLTLGSDTGGSIRQPASLCGVVGLKPTYGRVSRYGLVAFASSLDQIGGFSNSVKDSALLHEVISGHEPKDSTSVDVKVPRFSEAVGKNIKGLRIGIPREYFISGLNAEVEAKIRNAISQLQGLGAEIVDISLPHTEDALAVYYILAPAEASSNLSRYDGVRYGLRVEGEDLFQTYCKTRKSGFGPEVKRRIIIGTYVLSSGYYDAYYLQAQKVRTLIRKDFDEAFKKCDVIACPVSPFTAFKLGEKTSDPLTMYLSDIFTIPLNIAGLPGMSVPVGFDSGNLPIGLQLIGRQWDEETLFRVASQLEQIAPWAGTLPDTI